jgi:hypothetical protein
MAMPPRPRKATAPKAPAAPDFAALLAEARLPETTVPICLRADLAAEHEQLDRQLEQLVKKPSTKLGGDGRGPLIQRLEALQAEMEAKTYPFRLRALPRPQWRAHVAEHPPRKGADGEVDERDAAVGVNTETFYEATIRRCLVDPVLSDDAWAKLTDSLTDRQFSNLADAAWGLNRRDVDVPFSHAASLLNGTSESG